MELLNLIPESLILVVVATNIMGTLLKQTKLIMDNIIPILLLIFAVVCSMSLEGFTTTVMLQGIVCWGLAVGIHQTLHQIKKI